MRHHCTLALILQGLNAQLKTAQPHRAPLMAAPPPPGPLDYSHSHACVRWFRSTTLPLRVPLALLKGRCRARAFGTKRPTWNPRFEAYVTALRSATKNAPRDINFLKAATSGSVPGPLLPSGVLRCTERLARPDGTLLAVEFAWPVAATPLASRMNRSLSSSAQTTSNVVQTPEFRELLRTAPALVLVHGGAHCLCGRGTHRDLAFRLALATGGVVVMLDFRRPPDASTTDALDDVRTAYARVLELGAARACVGGDSAGGGLALAFAIKIRDAGATPDGAWERTPAPAGCLAISPWVDLGEARLGGSRLSNERWDFLPGDMIDLLARETIEASDDASHSPVKFDLHGLPPTLIQTGQCEVLHDQQVRLARAAAAQGTPTTLTVLRDMPQVSQIFSFCHETPRTALRQAGAFVRACLGTKGRRGVLVDVVSARGLTRGLFSKAPRVGVALLRADGGCGEVVWTERAVAGEMETYLFGQRGTRGNVFVELGDGERARIVVVVERRGIVAETIIDVAGGDDRLAKAEYALDGAQPVILAASVVCVDDASFVVPSGVATRPFEESEALPPHESHPKPAHRTPFPKPSVLM